MTKLETDTTPATSLGGSTPLRVAIIGAGPAGFYTAEHLLKQKQFNIQVDLFDRLPTPYGLVRGGVAPDHQKIKSVTKAYERTAKKSGFRYFGYVEFGTDITLDDLKAHYHQIVFATGIQAGKLLNIPGAELDGSHAASDFVAWYLFSVSRIYPHIWGIMPFLCSNPYI